MLFVGVVGGGVGRSGIVDVGVVVSVLVVVRRHWKTRRLGRLTR